MRECSNGNPWTIIILFLLTGMLSGTALHSQHDSLSIAQAFHDQGQLYHAKAILNAYLLDHPGDVEAKRLFIHTIYWMGEEDNALVLYQKALTEHPGHRGIQLDYAGVLAENGKYQKAHVILDEMLHNNPSDQDALYLHAATWYWQGYVNKGLESLEKGGFQDEQYSEVATLKRELQIANALNTSLDANYIWDDQPLQRPMLEIRAEKWQSPFFHPGMTAAYSPFSNDSTTFQTFIFTLDNLFDFRTIGLKVHPAASVLHSVHPTTFLWDVSIGKRLLRHFEFQFGWNRSVYPHTFSAIENVLTFDRLKFGLLFQKKDSWLGAAAYRVDEFKDVNQVATGYAWVLSPPVGSAVFHVRIGYGFNVSDAEDNRFQSIETLEQILIDYMPGEQIEGNYDPYFTPEDQFAHAGLVSFRFSGNNSLFLELGGSYGFHGHTDQPYLFLNEVEGSVAISRGYYETDYHPVELRFSAGRQLSQSITISFTYAFLKTLFYQRHSTGMQINKRFLP